MTGFNDAAIFDRVLTYVKEFSTAVDVGAHKGVWSERMADRFNTLYCFEPNILLYNRLVAWAADSFCDVRVYNVGILDMDDVKGTLFYDDRTTAQRGRFVKRDDDGDIEIKTLDSYRIKRCGLLKIDIEGGELLALRGARRIIRHQRPVIVVEHKYRQSARFGWKLHELYSFMYEYKYRKVFDDYPLPNLVFAL